MRFLIVLAVAMIAVVACSNDSSNDSGGDVLVLRGLDIEPDEYRAAVRQMFVEEFGVGLFCNQIQGLSPRELVDIFRSDDDEPLDERLLERGEPKPGQKANPDHAERAAQIFLDECKRIS